MMIIEDKENINGMRNKRFLLGEMKLKINRLTEELNKLAKQFKKSNKQL
jgi:hypothetical protein